MGRCATSRVDGPLLLGLHNRREWDFDRFAIPANGWNPKCRGDQPVLNQSTSSVHTNAPTLGQLARREGIKLYLWTRHGSKRSTIYRSRFSSVSIVSVLEIKGVSLSKFRNRRYILARLALPILGGGP